MGRRCSIIAQTFVRHIAYDRRFATRTPIRDLQHRLVVAPPLVYGDQRLMVHDLTIVPHVAISWHDDDFGNRIATLEAEHIELAVESKYEATIERFAGKTRATAIRHRVTFPSTAMRNVPASFMQFDESVYDRATRISQFVAAHMRCVPGSTSVLTIAAKAFAQASGVCQDYARIMVAIDTFYGNLLAGAKRTLGSRSSHHQPIRRAPSSGVGSYTRAVHKSRLRLHRNRTRFRRRDPNFGALHRSVRRRVYDIAFHRPYFDRIRGLTRVGRASGATRENRVCQFRFWK